jgi:hypothetical protein
VFQIQLFLSDIIITPTINKLIDWCLMPTLAMFQLYRGSIKRWQLYVYLENKEYFKNGAFVYIDVSFHH